MKCPSLIWLAGDAVPETIPCDRLSPEQKDKLNSNPIFSHYVRCGMKDEQALDEIGRYQPSAVCISIMFSCFHDTAERLARKIRARFPHIVIIAGGSHVTVNFRDVLASGAIDYCLRYEGEQTLPRLLHLIEDGMPADSVEGIAYGRDPVVYNRSHTWIRNLDEVHPAYDMISPGDYSRTVTVITSRGCPFACEFCTVHLSMGRAYRARSARNVVDELETYINRGFTRFNIEDDNFTFDVDRAKEICKGIADRGLHCEIYLPNGVAVQSLDEECIRLMAAAGVKKLFMGLETTSEDLLSALKKKHTSLLQIQTAVRLCRQYGIAAGGSLIIGFPSQTIEDILLDIATLIRLNIAIYAINALYPLPGTEMYEECIRRGLLTGKEDPIFLGSDNYVIHNDSFSKEDLYSLWVCVKGYTKWGYLNGSYINTDSAGLKEALLLIARALDGTAADDSLEVPARRVNADLISSHYKVFSDMTLGFVYMLTGRWCTCTVSEGDIVRILYHDAASDAPRALRRLKEMLRSPDHV